ncbi:glyoxal oxidase N-terminus-domain-containing protein [Globomyces pollinis-pini]|nr:glyoxal oxidase N-terminus-domain-containing protein [Globomyces pollinis-pini]
MSCDAKQRCPAGYCCSKYGQCGQTSEHCDLGKGCEPLLGECEGKESDCNAKADICSKPRPLPSLSDMTCGPKNGNKQCPGGYCCSSSGFCGTTPDHCGAGCMQRIGPCAINGFSDPCIKGSPPREDGKCGSKYNNALCPMELPCCSEFGSCGLTSDHCGPTCQYGLGLCFPPGSKSLYAPRTGKFAVEGESLVPAMHTIVHHNGKVIFLDKVENYTQATLPNGQYAYSSEWDPATGSGVPLAYKTNAFCSAGGFDAEGNLLNFGGADPLADIDPTVGDGFNAVRILKRPCQGDGCNWQEYGNIKMAGKRWYPSTVNLEDGTFFIIGGVNFIGDLNEEKFNTPTWEIYPPPNGTAKDHFMPFLQEVKPNQLYPHTVLLKSGKLFILAGKRAILFDHRKNITEELPNIVGMYRTYPETGASILFPLSSADNYSAKIMICGGADIADISSNTDATCGIISPEAPNPKWTYENMPDSRVMVEGVNLPDGTIFFTNGASKGAQGFENAAKPALHPNLYVPWLPEGERWIVLKNTTIPRVYHSGAQLLPDARVIISGSNPHQQPVLSGSTLLSDPNLPTEFRVEIFTPPYLTTGRPRPSISKIPTKVSYNSRVNIEGDWDFSIDPVIKVVMIHGGFQTHSMHFSQRMIYLDVVNSSTKQLTCVTPPDGRVAPPGPYMVFVVAAGVPSVAKWVFIG